MADTENQPNSKVGSVFDLPSKSWQFVKDNWQMFAVVNILSILSAVAAGFGNEDKEDKGSPFQGADPSGIVSGQELGALLGLGVITVLLFIAVSIFLYAMAMVLELKAAKGEKPNLNSLVEGAKKYWLRLFGLAILSGLIIVGGLILLIVPGLIAIARLVFAPYIMIERDLGIIDSMKASNEMAKDRFGQIWAALLIVILIAFAASAVSAIPMVGPIIGTAITIAFSLVIVLRYLEIKKDTIKPSSQPTAQISNS